MGYSRNEEKYSGGRLSSRRSCKGTEERGVLVKIIRSHGSEKFLNGSLHRSRDRRTAKYLT